MRSLVFFLIPVSLFALTELQSDSMLCQADWIAKTFNFETAKTPPPLIAAQPQKCLNTAAVWFSIDLAQLKEPSLEALTHEALWESLKIIGVEGVHLKGLKTGGEYRTAIAIDPKWGKDWAPFASVLQKKKLVLITDSIGTSTGIGADFQLALKNVGDYPGIYHLIEIDSQDWTLLPKVSASELVGNISWLSLQSLQKKGYVPERFSSYVKQSNWNATATTKCADGKIRRWIYLKENQKDPVIDWLNPTFAGCRIAAADALDSIYNLGTKILQIDANIHRGAVEALALWARKLGAFSAMDNQSGIDEMKTCSSDLITDTITRAALLHALIAQDAGVLKLIYRLFLEEGIEAERLIHVLQPFDQFACDWTEFALHPKKKYHYYDETLTGEALHLRLLQQDAQQIKEKTPSTWPKFCADALGIKSWDEHREEIGSAHLLLAFFYAMQPGAFSFSASDLLGAISSEPIDLTSTNEHTLYPSIAGQMKNPNSFAMKLRNILGARKEYSLMSAELIAVPDTAEPGLLLLIHRLKSNSMLHILAINFGRTEASQVLEIPQTRNTTAINTLTRLAETKPLASSSIRIQLSPLSAKSIIFQPKYYD